MEITFDRAKNRSNLAKHGVSLKEAGSIEWESLWAIEDRRRGYGETRMIGYALIRARLYCVVYTDRGEERRIISLRKANKTEVSPFEKCQYFTIVGAPVFLWGLPISSKLRLN